MKPFQTLSLAVSVITLMTLAGGSAAAQEDTGWYIGASAGDSRSRIDQERIQNELLGAGLATATFDDDEDHFGYKGFGGYQFNRHIALEGGYFDLGNFNFEALTVPAGTLRGEVKVKGINLDLVGLVPFTGKFSAFGRIGATYAETKDSFAGTGAVVVADPDRRARTGHYKFGAGLQYAFTESFAMRTEAERYRIDDAVGNDADIDLFSAGFVYRFGGERLQAVAAVAPPPPAPIPESTPPAPPRDSDNDGVTDDIDKCPGTPRGVAVDATGCPLKGSVTLEGINFEFNSALLTAESRNILGELAANLKKYPRLRIELQGHTDSVGSDAYNRSLSQRRAESVRQYLIDSGVSADRLTARGYGEAQPVDRNDTDAGRARNRRVVMDVTANPGEVKVEGEGSAQ